MPGSLISLLRAKTAETFSHARRSCAWNRINISHFSHVNVSAFPRVQIHHLLSPRCRSSPNMESFANAFYLRLASPAPSALNPVVDLSLLLPRRPLLLGIQRSSSSPSSALATTPFDEALATAPAPAAQLLLLQCRDQIAVGRSRIPSQPHSVHFPATFSTTVRTHDLWNADCVATVLLDTDWLPPSTGSSPYCPRAYCSQRPFR